VIDAVLFDWGHTLVRSDWSERLGLEGNRIGLAAVGRNDLPEPEALTRYFEERLQELFPIDAEDEVDLLSISRVGFLDLGCELSEEELERYIGSSQGFWGRSFEPHPNIGVLVESLRGAGYSLGLVSNNATPIRHFFVPLAFDCVVLSSEVGKQKPHPAIFQRALDDLERTGAYRLRRRQARPGRRRRGGAGNADRPGGVVLPPPGQRRGRS
jgi:FMN phosphatase YigB (HAD superfamily)